MQTNTQKQHPILAKIPDNIWEHIFERSFNEDNLKLANKQFCEINREELPDNDAQAFVLMVLCHPEISAAKHLSFARDVLDLPENWIFFLSAALGVTTILQCLKEQESGPNLLSMIIEYNYRAFRWAAENGHLSTVQWLTINSANHWTAMTVVENHFAFRQAVTNRSLDVQKWLLRNTGCFAYAEEHVHEYAEIVRLFVQEIIAELRQEQETFIINHPNTAYNITCPERAEHCFYLLRNLIRRNDAALDGDMEFLLDIHSVRTIAHQEKTLGQSNELLKLARRINNRKAFDLLITIPAVRTLAQQNNFYREEQEGGFDLSLLAQNNESAMTALTQGETKRLDAAIQHYQPQINTTGVNNVINDLYKELVQRYTMHPAIIVINGTEQKLPLSYEDFNALNLQGKDLEQALHSYYQHKDHSALRYLSKPNLWIHPQASYINTSEDGHTHWAMIEGYQPLIALLYLAAKDTKIPATNGHTLKTRLDHFISELALLGRAHNWDKTRMRNGSLEAFDDLEGDRPSCWSGVKRRLFQSVIGHPMLAILTEDIIKQEVKDFALTHFKSNINKNNQSELKEAFDAVIDMSGDGRKLECLNIPKEKQQGFHLYLSQKYGAAYTTDSFLLNLVRDTLSLDSFSFINGCHAMKLDGLTKLYDYLSQLTKKLPVSASSQAGFYKPPPVPPPKKLVEKISNFFCCK